MNAGSDVRRNLVDRLTAPDDRDAHFGGGRGRNNRLEAASLITPIAGEDRALRYHSLIAGFLKEQLQREAPEQVPRLRRVAADWYEAQGRAVPAIDHALASGDFAHAKELLRQHAPSLLGQGRMRLLTRWLDAMPEAALQERPLLLVLRVWAVTFTRGPWEAMELLRHTGLETTADEPAVRPHVLALRPLLLAMIDRFEEALDVGHKSLEHWPTSSPFPDMVLGNAMADVFAVMGHNAEARALLETARSIQSEGASAFNLMYSQAGGLSAPARGDDTMEFALSEDQRMMQDSVRKALAGESTLARVRTAVDGALPRDDKVWATLCELGIPALLVPEEHGGLGLALLDAAVASEELGRAVAPAPFLGTAVLAPLALRAAGSPAQQAEWLPRIASGRSLVGVAFTEGFSGARDGAGVRIANGRLNGSALFVVDGVAADTCIVAERGGAMHLVHAKASGLQRRTLRAVDGTRPTLDLRFENVEAQPLPGANAAVLARLRDAAWIMLAADALGAGWAMIDKAVAYSKERRQFGRLIGSFQAVKHLCAEMATELEPGRALLWYAAHAYDVMPDEAPLYAAHGKALLDDAGRFVARTATEVHGGIGITDELGLHYWFKRIAFDRALYGSPEQVRRHAATLQDLVAA